MGRDKLFRRRAPQQRSAMRGVELLQVYPLKSETLTDVDIIAIHGLDTTSLDTWTWKDKNEKINWLKHPKMLPGRIPKARIFTCDWPADLFTDNTTVQMTPKELARGLLLGIKSQLGADSTRPIIFIASCLGGIILIQAMEIAANGSEYSKLWGLTRGIIFLGTPFRGTAFDKVADRAIKLLKLQAKFTSKAVTDLLNILKGPNEFLQDLVGEFTRICQHRESKQPCHLAIFYETGKGNLLRKVPLLAGFADVLNEPTPLVDKHSARLDMVTNPVPLERTHVLMNKFYGPRDPGYDAVAGRIEIILCEIREARPIEKANIWIRNEHYCLRNLGIERLSGALLPMDRCYINLSIVEKRGDEATSSENGTHEDRLLPKETRKIELSTLFNSFEIRSIDETKKENEKVTVIPRRILIRGRAGVGKTTLCKRMIYEFIYKKMWSDLFDHVLWVPLRNLKLRGRRSGGESSLEWLFQHEYFSQSLEPRDLAKALCGALTDSKYLFILDGLDEVSQDLDKDMFKLLEKLLNQPDVIITSRPGATLPLTLERVDLELETIGFYPNQVDAYIGSAFPDPETGEPDTSKAEGVKSFLHHHPLIQDLVRIPIQLDAFCYTWNFDSGEKDVQETMAAVYENIELRLWMKDAVNLGKLTEHQIEEFNESEVRGLMEIDLHRIEILAFTGMYNNIVEFEPKHRSMITRHFPEEFSKPFSSLTTMTPLNSLLSRVSFLRSSDRSSTITIASYHFLHLSFQEYFAARYFVRQWEARKQLKCLIVDGGRSEKIYPRVFIHEKKYNARYDMFWRFVAGLLNEEQEVIGFFQTIEEEPHDLLGPVHQKLVAHCLSEVSTKMPLRKCLEEQLSQWVVFECNRNYEPLFAGEIILSGEMLKEILNKESELKERALKGLGRVRVLSGTILSEIAAQLQDNSTQVKLAALRALRGQRLTEDHLRKISACLEVKNLWLCSAAIQALENQHLTDECLETVEACIKDANHAMGVGVIDMLEGWQLTERHIQAVIECLSGKFHDFRYPILTVLKGQSLTEEHVQKIEACLKDTDDWFRAEALKMLKGREEDARDIEERRKDDDPRFTRMDEYEYFRTIEAYLGNHRQKPEDWKATNADLLKMEEYFKDHDEHMRAEALSFLKDEQLTQNPQRPQSDRFGIMLAIKSSGCQSSIITPFLEDEDWRVRQEALGALKSQARSILSGEILVAVIACCNDDNVNVRWDAVRLFQGWEILDEQPFQAVKACLKDRFSFVRCDAIKVFQSWPTLSPDLLQTISEFITDEDWSIRTAALNAIEGKPNLSEEVLQSVAACIEDKITLVQRAAINVLKSLPCLSERIRQSIAAHFRGASDDSRREAIELLKGQEGLSEESKQAIAACLRGSATKAVANALISQQALSAILDEDFEFFYEFLLDESFSEHVSWRVKDGISYITLGHEEYLQPLPDGFADKIRQAQERLGVPNMRARSLKESSTRLEDQKSVEVASSVKSVNRIARRLTA
ncbi:armadillo-type protein [Xylaria curta]|nr:armadillo-type protein [Xylaria curta]